MVIVTHVLLIVWNVQIAIPVISATLITFILPHIVPAFPNHAFRLTVLPAQLNLKTQRALTVIVDTIYPNP